MSYDLQIWSVRPYLGDSFSDPQLWQSVSRAWTYERKNWQIVVSASDKVEPEDIPQDVSKILPSIEWLSHLNLEGARTQAAERLLRTTADLIARSAHGVIVDPQEGTVRLPSGVKRFMLPRSKQVFEVISMSWWALDTPLLTHQGKRAFVDLLERTLPEALSKRYGTYEPPQHRYIETGKEQFVTFLDENQHDIVVWYPNRPVVSVCFAFPKPLGAHKLGFRANHVSVEIERAVLSEPGWAKSLANFWQTASLLMGPFYGDVRMLGGYKWMGATVSSSGNGSEHPVKSWWWKGIPQDLGLAVVLGGVYQRLWSAFGSAGTTVNGLAFASVDNWSGSSDVSKIVGRPPKDQVQRPCKWIDGPVNKNTFRSIVDRLRKNPPDKRSEYASAWPFEKPFLP